MGSGFSCCGAENEHWLAANEGSHSELTAVTPKMINFLLIFI